MPHKRFKAVIPAAGLGTRFLPATKAMPKEMLPVVDKPAIQYVVEEAVPAGIHDILIIIGRNKNNLSNHFDSVPELEDKLRAKGDHGKLAKVVQSTDLADIHFVRQGEPKGLGHAVLRARAHVGDMAVRRAARRRPHRRARSAAHEDDRGAGAHAAPRSSPSWRSIPTRSTCTVPPPSSRPTIPTSCKVTGLVEKPAEEDAPSNLAVIGRYVLNPGVFDVLERTEPGKGGEIQLTDALQEIAADAEGPGVYGVVFRGRRYDTGDRVDYIKAIVQLAADREDLGPELRPWFKEFAATL